MLRTSDHLVCSPGWFTLLPLSSAILCDRSLDSACHSAVAYDPHISWAGPGARLFPSLLVRSSLRPGSHLHDLYSGSVPSGCICLSGGVLCLDGWAWWGLSLPGGGAWWGLSLPGGGAWWGRSLTGGFCIFLHYFHPPRPSCRGVAVTCQFPFPLLSECPCGPVSLPPCSGLNPTVHW